VVSKVAFLGHGHQLLASPRTAAPKEWINGQPVESACRSPESNSASNYVIPGAAADILLYRLTPSTL